MGEGNRNDVMEPTGEKKIRKGVTMWLNRFFLTLGSAEGRRGLLAVITWLAFPLLYDCCHSVLCRKIDMAPTL